MASICSAHNTLLLPEPHPRPAHTPGGGSAGSTQSSPRMAALHPHSTALGTVTAPAALEAWPQTPPQGSAGTPRVHGTSVCQAQEQHATLQSQDRWGGRRASGAELGLCAMLGTRSCHTSVPRPPHSHALLVPHCHVPTAGRPAARAAAQLLHVAHAYGLPAPPVWVTGAYVSAGANTEMESQA